MPEGFTWEGIRIGARETRLIQVTVQCSMLLALGSVNPWFQPERVCRFVA